MNTDSPSLTILAAQFPISLEIEKNLHTMLAVLEHVAEDEVVVFPEGALSGYDADPHFVDAIPLSVLGKAQQTLQAEVDRRKIHLIFGSCLFEGGQWLNAGLYLSSDATPFVYRKINLAANERGHFQAGATLPVFTLNIGGAPVVAGMQLCREIRFPEQWQYLARSGAGILFYLTNAVGDSGVQDVWRSHVISRAAENQRFVVAANNAHAEQKCPTMIVAPSGNVLAEVASAGVEILRAQVDLAEVSDWYLNQARTDVVRVLAGHP